MENSYSYRLISSNDNYIAHYGVLGMKWGVWNEETKARYMRGEEVRRDPESRGYSKVTSDKMPEVAKRMSMNHADAQWFIKNFDQKNRAELVEKANKVTNDGETVYERLMRKYEKMAAELDTDDVVYRDATEDLEEVCNDILNLVGDSTMYESPSGNYFIEYYISDDPFDYDKIIDLNLYEKKRD